MSTAPEIGRARRRVEDHRLVTGRGRYVDDIHIDGCLHAAFARSSEAHGRLNSIDTDDAAAHPDVVKVFAGEDFAHLGASTVNPLMPDLDPLPAVPLATELVSAVGMPVALVIARTSAAAVDAAELIWADIEPLEPKSPHTPREGCVRIRETWQTAPEAESNPAAKVSVSLQQPLVAPVSLEPRGLLADATSEPGRMTVWLGSQSPHRARDELAAILGVAVQDLRVVAPDVGGAFGMKASLYPEDIAIAAAAWSLQASIRWVATRSEEFLAATQGRGQSIDAELSADTDGKFLSLEAIVRAPLGHWMPYSAVVPPRNAGRILPGPYRCAAVDTDAGGVSCNSAAVGIYRGAGRPEAALTIELLIERLAEALDLDPGEIRRRNLIEPDAMPFTTPTGQVFDSGDYPAALARACTLLGAGNRDDEDNGRLLRGSSAIVYVEPSGTGWETARLTLNGDGSVTAATGSATQGQGRVTATQQIVADHLQIAPEAVFVIEGDSAAPDTGTGALASRSTAIGGSALVTACAELRRIVAEQTGQTWDDEQGLPDWTTIAGQTGTVTADTIFTAAGEAWGYGAVGCTISIDPDTGVLSIERLVWVDDAGTVINPMLAKGQLIGGIAQGIGEALLERIVYDEDGQLLTGSFMDYGIPRADDMPSVTVERMETPSPLNPLGAKGVGEAGTIGAPAAIACAVMDALRPVGVKHLDMPYTPARLWQAIQDAKRDK